MPCCAPKWYDYYNSACPSRAYSNWLDVRIRQCTFQSCAICQRYVSDGQAAAFCLSCLSCIFQSGLVTLRARMPYSYLGVALGKHMLPTLEEKAKDWAQVHGLGIRHAELKDRSDLGLTAPFTVLPSAFPRHLFGLAQELQYHFNLLYAKIAVDFEFVQETLAPIVKADVFTARLLAIYEKYAGALGSSKLVYLRRTAVVKGREMFSRATGPSYHTCDLRIASSTVQDEGISQRKFFNLQRADYMLQSGDQASKFKLFSSQQDDNHLLLRQVEVNTIAPSAAGIAQRAHEMHRYLLRELSYPEEKIRAHLAKNRGLQSMAKGLLHAWKAFGDPEAILLIVVEDVNQNIFDQRLVEYAVKSLSDVYVPTERLTLTDVFLQCDLMEQKDLVFLPTQRRVGLVYFRSGYAPAQYPSDREWEARLRIERSNAIKCPWIGYHLVGCKIFQEALGRPGVLARFMKDDEETAKKMHSTFAWQAVLSDVLENPKLRSMLEQSPQDFVLKPQREGGGNNVYGLDIIKLLELGKQEGKDDEFWQQFILMERFSPPVFCGYVAKALSPVMLSPCVSELGMFGYLLGSMDDAGAISVTENEASGYLYRTKSSQANEGGLMSGVAYLDSVWLSD